MEEEDCPLGNGKVSLFAIRWQRLSSHALSIASPQPRTPFWLWPHVLSLEAPLVAMLWLAALARLNDFTLMPGVLSGLGLAVWLIYLADRVMDTLGVPVETLSIRHRFYHRHRWPILLRVMPVGLGMLVWISLWVIPAGLLAHSLAQVIPIAIYLVLYSITSLTMRRWMLQAGVLLVLLFVNALPLSLGLRITISMLIASGSALMLTLRWHENIGQFFRKELAAGLLFAFGCTTWTRLHTLGAEGPENWVELILLAMLFVSNLALITAQEEGPSTASPSARGTVISALVITLLTLAAIPQGYLSATMLPLTLAVGAGLIGLELLRQNRHRLSPEGFRVFADIIVTLPAIILVVQP